MDRSCCLIALPLVSALTFVNTYLTNVQPLSLTSPSDMVPPLITLEEHYLSQSIRKHLADTGSKDPYADFPAPLIDKLTSQGPDRLAALDSGKVFADPFTQPIERISSRMPNDK